MSQNLQPPSFISDVKTYAEYKEDLKRWSRLTSLDKKLQAEMVVYYLDGHPSRIKEKITTQIGNKLQGETVDGVSVDGITVLLNFLDTIYGKDDMADVWDKYKTFSNHHRKSDEDISDFLPNWEMSYHKLKATGCEYSDSILGLKLLEDAQLSDMDTKLVLTGVNFNEGKTKKNLQTQITNSLKKFTGRSVISSNSNLAVSVKAEPTYLSQIEEVLLAKGWKPPAKTSSGRRRSRSASPSRERKPNNYKGKKNGFGENGRPRKCYLCGCDHEHNCNCPCVYHMANNCPRRKGAVKNSKTDNSKSKPDLGLFIDSNIDSAFLVTDEGEDQVFMINEKLQELVLLSATYQEGVVDCACPTTVAGEKWVHDFLSHLPSKLRSSVQTAASERVFKFGGGEKRKSKGIIILPCSIGGKNIKLKTEIVEAEFPLLLGNTFLKRASAVLFIGEEKARILESEVSMKETCTGHFAIKICLPLEGAEFVTVQDAQSAQAEKQIHECLVASTDKLSYKDIVKLHQIFGHVSVSKLEKLISNSNKMSDEVKGFLQEVEMNCESCKVNQKAKPRPVVSLPRASQFNQIVTVDLKQYKNNDDNYILYLVDMFTRLTVGVFIPRKLPAIVGEKMMEKWIAVFGRMDMIHSDRGGEFCCSELADIAEYIGVRSSFTAASSPNQNGINERNHAIVDRMIDKMRTQDSTLSADVALTWALVAKNTLENVSGFSPFQLVFGKGPVLPSVYTTGPPGYEEVVMEKSVANHINALFLAREAYVQGESDKILKKALKQRIYKRGEDVNIGDWIYYNDKGKWYGPVKVSAKDGKSLYVVRGGKLVTVNTDYAQLATFDGKFVGHRREQDELNDQERTGSSSKEKQMTQKSNLEKESSTTTTEKQITHNSNLESESITAEKSSNSETAAPASINQQDDNKTLPSGPANILKAGNVVRFKDGDDTKEGKILRRAGKKGGKYDQWWNLVNSETGKIDHVDFGKVSMLELVSNETETDKTVADQNVYVVGIPRYRHDEKTCMKAKEKELNAWDEYQVYEEVRDEGQTRLGTNWVLTEKVDGDGARIVKARLTIRGDQEDTDGVRKDSPTVRKSNIKIFTVVAARERWDIKTSDVASAFLQGIEIDRDVFILPPKEKRIPGVLWRLLKPVYGLVDASRGWYLALDEEFVKAGCERCTLDPAMYLHFSENNDTKTLEGMALTHVDDVLHGGDDEFDNNVMGSVKSSFKFGLEEAECFRYVGMNMTQTEDGILVDQDHYIKGLELPDMDVALDLQVNDTLTAEGQTVFRGCIAKILHVGYQSRPDICFEAKCLSTKFGKATKGDLRTALKKMQKLHGIHTRMFFPRLGPLSELTYVGFGDAGIRSMPDKLSSVGGQVILLADCSKDLACVLNWRSKKLVRKVISSLAGEALALVAAIGEMVYNKAIMKQIYGEEIEDIPVIMFTDSKNLFEAVYSTALVEDAWLIPDIAVIKDALENGTITCLRRVESEKMLANCLTKAGASSEELMTVLQTGYYTVPAGLDG